MRHKGVKAYIRIAGYFGVIRLSVYYMLRLKREICGAIFILTMIFWGSIASAAVAVVTDVRVGQHSQSTRFVLELDRQVKFSVFMLSNPYRVVIDLPEVGWRLPQRPLPFNRGLVKQFRYGLFRPGTSKSTANELSWKQSQHY